MQIQAVSAHPIPFGYAPALRASPSESLGQFAPSPTLAISVRSSFRWKRAALSLPECSWHSAPAVWKGKSLPALSLPPSGRSAPHWEAGQIPVQLPAQVLMELVCQLPRLPLGHRPAFSVSPSEYPEPFDQSPFGMYASPPRKSAALYRLRLSRSAPPFSVLLGLYQEPLRTVFAHPIPFGYAPALRALPSELLGLFDPSLTLAISARSSFRWKRTALSLPERSWHSAQAV